MLASLTTQQTELWQNLPPEQKEWEVLSFSQLQSFGKCGFQWYLNYKLGYTSWTKSTALTKGSMIHEGLASLYEFIKDRKGNAEQWKAAKLPAITTQWLNSGEEEPIQLAGHVTWLLDRYTAQQAAMDLGHTVLAVEKHFLIPVTTLTGRHFLLQGYIDLITVDLNGEIWLWDHKSGTKFWTPIEAVMDPQLPTYAIALREEGIVPHGMIINMINTYDYKDKSKVLQEKLFKREVTHRTETELMNIAREILNAADRWLEAIDSSIIPSRRMSKDCSWCSYADACLMDLKGIPVEVTLADSFKKKETLPQTTITLEL